jgi:hypothetical protein
VNGSDRQRHDKTIQIEFPKGQFFPNLEVVFPDRLRWNYLHRVGKYFRQRLERGRQHPNKWKQNQHKAKNEDQINKGIEKPSFPRCGRTSPILAFFATRISSFHSRPTASAA